MRPDRSAVNPSADALASVLGRSDALARRGTCARGAQRAGKTNGWTLTRGATNNGSDRGLWLGSPRLSWAATSIQRRCSTPAQRTSTTLG